MGLCCIKDCSRPHYALGFCEMHWRRNRKHGSPLGGDRNHAPPEERFWRRVKKTGTCWNWLGAPSNAGYGRFQIGGKGSPYVGPHRFSYEMHCEPVPEGFVVMHSCDNRLCVNPAHLSVGTPRDNTTDMISKGRKRTVAPVGVENGKAVLTPDLVRYIRSKPNESHAALARELGVGASTIRGVRDGRVWSHVK